MPKLTDLSFDFKAENGERLTFKAPVSVSTSGVFSVRFPEEVDASVRELLKNGWKSKTNKIVQIEIQKTGAAIVSTDLDSCKELLSHASREQLKCEIKRELVICYKLDLNVAYVREHETGKIFQSGTKTANRDMTGASWHGQLSGSRSRPCYSVGIGAIVFEKTTATRPSGFSKKYAVAGIHGTVCSLGDNGRRLNAFIGLYFDPERESDVREIPYTEETARFFADSIMSLVMVADRLERFFDSPETILSTLQKKQAILPSDNSE